MQRLETNYGVQFRDPTAQQQRNALKCTFGQPKAVYRGEHYLGNVLIGNPGCQGGSEAQVRNLVLPLQVPFEFQTDGDGATMDRLLDLHQLRHEPTSNRFANFSRCCYHAYQDGRTRNAALYHLSFRKLRLMVWDWTRHSSYRDIDLIERNGVPSPRCPAQMPICPP